MAHEIERKFLVKELPIDLESYPSNEIQQGYIQITDDGTEERVRKKGERFYHTVKSGEGLVREESEREISPEEFHKLWSKTEGKRIIKTRYDIEYGGLLIELDIFSGSMQGLVVAEVEFSSEEESSKFAPPKWFGDEITRDERYKNKFLALHGLPPGTKA